MSLRFLFMMKGRNFQYGATGPSSESVVERSVGVENGVEPLLSLLETLILAQSHGNVEGNVEEDLPVVRGIGAAVAEVDVGQRIGSLDEPPTLFEMDPMPVYA
jgi:hypothetical protein